MKTAKPGCEHARPRFVSIAAVAKELGVSTKTVRRQITAGELPSHRVGRAVRVAEDDLEAFRKRCRS